MSQSNNGQSHFMLGSKGQHLSYADLKLAVLTGQLSLLSFLMNGGYVIFDLCYGLYHSWPLLSSAALLSLISFLLNRQGVHFPAKLILGLTTNLTIFYFSSIEPIETALSFLFVTCALGAICTLGFQQKKLALLFVLLPVVLFIFSVVLDLGLFTRRTSSDEYVRLNMIINFLATFFGAVLMFYFMLSLNHHSEHALRENEKRLHDNNEQLVKVNKELDRFVYSASHDLRSPISSVRGLINLIKLDPQAPDTKSYLDMMDSQLVGLNKLIEDIVAYSRNARVEVKSEVIYLKTMVDEILASLRFNPNAEKVHLDVHVPDDLILYSDVTRLRIVLANLLSNAFKYSNPRNENQFIKISSAQTPTHLHISVRDNGVGIDRQFLPNIFDMFFQANEKAEGSGLGLYIVKETLEKMDGTIRVESEVGNGSEFIVTLPIQQVETTSLGREMS